MAALSRDRIDLAIVLMATLEAASGFEFTTILPGRKIIACASTHPLSRKQRLPPIDLTDYP